MTRRALLAGVVSTGFLCAGASPGWSAPNYIRRGNAKASIRFAAGPAASGAAGPSVSRRAIAGPVVFAAFVGAASAAAALRRRGPAGGQGLSMLAADAPDSAPAPPAEVAAEPVHRVRVTMGYRAEPAAAALAEAPAPFIRADEPFTNLRDRDFPSASGGNGITPLARE